MEVELEGSQLDIGIAVKRQQIEQNFVLRGIGKSWVGFFDWYNSNWGFAKTPPSNYGQTAAERRHMFLGRPLFLFLLDSRLRLVTWYWQVVCEECHQSISSVSVGSYSCFTGISVAINMTNASLDGLLCISQISAKLLKQSHHHNGDQAARQPHLLRSICVHLLGALAKPVRLFVASLRSQLMFSMFVDLQEFGWNLKGGLLDPRFGGLNGTMG